jgi:hypothetical protein
MIRGRSKRISNDLFWILRLSRKTSRSRNGGPDEIREGNEVKGKETKSTTTTVLKSRQK